MYPPAPFSSPVPGIGGASPAQAAADLARQLTANGISGIYTASAEQFAVISVTAELTIWTNGRLLWCTHRGEHHTWPDAGAAATSLAALVAALS